MRDTRRADELATYWRRGKAIHLAAVTGQPVAAWDRALDAWHVCQWDVELLAEEVQAGHELDPVRTAELAEASMAHAVGRIHLQLVELRRSIADSLPAWVRRLVR